MNETWIVMHPSGDEAWAFGSKSKATEWAIEANKKGEEHWAFRLWLLRNNEMIFQGRLWRPFGLDFQTDPWRRRSCDE